MNGSQSAIRGRFASGTGEVFAVSLEGSSNSVIDQNSICANAGNTGGGIRITGESHNVVVRRNFIGAFGGQLASFGILAEDCGGGAPWIVDNYEISSEGPNPSTVVNAIRAEGNCHPTIDNNGPIFGGNEGQTVGTVGIYCGAGAASGVASLCSILGNQEIRGSRFGFPPFAAGVQCANGGCNRIANNDINGNSAVRVFGVIVEDAGPVIDRNTITGGCGTMSGVGVFAENSYSRIQNNFIRAGTCEDNASNGGFVGLLNKFDTGGNELVVHSNTIFGGGDTSLPCTSVAVHTESVTVGSVGGLGGVYRNNILAPGHCNQSFGFSEGDASADPRILENNNFDVHKPPTALYLDEAMTGVNTVAAINGLSDVSAAANISVDSQFVSYSNDLHINAGSLCIGAGTSVGAPLRDYDGDTRDTAAPDIGADER